MKAIQGSSERHNHLWQALNVVPSQSDHGNGMMPHLSAYNVSNVYHLVSPQASVAVPPAITATDGTELTQVHSEQLVAMQAIFPVGSPTAKSHTNYDIPNNIPATSQKW